MQKDRIKQHILYKLKCGICREYFEVTHGLQKICPKCKEKYRSLYETKMEVI